MDDTMITVTVGRSSTVESERSNEVEESSEEE
jgi:hypothetical protein